MLMLEELRSVGREVQVFEPVVFTKPWAIELADGCRIDSFSKLEGGLGLSVGERVHVASFAHLNTGGGKLTIGADACVASGGHIVTGGNKTTGISMSAASPRELQDLTELDIVIGRFAVVLTGAIILGVSLGEGAVAAAGSVVTKPIPAWEVWAGNPARFLKHREIDPRFAYADLLL